MRYIIFVIIGMFIVACTSENKKEQDDYLSNEIERLNKRIEFVRSSIENIKETEPHSRRNLVMEDRVKWVCDVFNRIEQNLQNNDLIVREILNLEEAFEYLSSKMDANFNTIDDVITNKFDIHLKELDALHLSVMSSELENKIKIKHSLKSVQEGILNTILMMSRTDKYTFEKAEILAYDRNNSGFKAKEGDSVEVTLFTVAYDTTYLPNLIYWIDDTTRSESTAIHAKDWYSMKFGGNKGEHTVVGKYNLYPNNREEFKDWSFTYTIE